MASSRIDLHLIYSRLCREFTQDGHVLEVQIFRLEDRANWRLNVINEEGTSVVWQQPFDTEQNAADAFHEMLEREGIGAFLDNDDEHSVIFNLCLLH